MTTSRPRARIPLNDTRPQYDAIRDEVERGHGRACWSGWFILGPEVAAFEQEFAAFCGAGTRSASATAPTRSTWRCARWGSARATR